MRELTLEELELISGGTDTTTEVDAIVVVADGGDSGDWGDWGDWGDYGDWGDGGGGGGGGDTAPPSYEEWFQDQCAQDLQNDVKAREIEAQIKAMPDWNEREYAAVIYVTAAGEYKVGPLARGMTVAEAAAAGLDAPETRIPIPTDLEGGFIVSVVHNHPDVGYDAAEDLENRYPSFYTDSSGQPGGDYAFFDQVIGSGMVANDARFANSAAFSQYILGPDGVLREFNKSDGRVTASSDTNPSSRENLAADRPCAQ